jgi:Uma2 family endonuclease
MLKTLRKPQIRIGPEDHGRRMSLDDFDHAIARDGHRFELNKGIVEMSEVPGSEHLAQVEELKEQLYAYKLAKRGVIHTVASSNEAKILVSGSQSERHPDLSVYLTPPPDVEDFWSVWIPPIVIEVVSKQSSKRDYQDKPDEYLEFGIDEYWIVDAAKNQMTVLQRWRGQWKSMVVRPPKKYSTQLLTGFALDVKRVMSAAKSRSSK